MCMAFHWDKEENTRVGFWSQVAAPVRINSWILRRISVVWS
jgi:hypothetical protein